MELSDTINRKEPFTRWEIYKLVWNLSVPSILAQLTYIIMEYIDAIMVGSLGVKSAGAIGLVATSTWFLYGLCRACSSGFSVQVAQAVGANDKNKSKNLFRESNCSILCFCDNWSSNFSSFAKMAWRRAGTLEGSLYLFFDFLSFYSYCPVK